MFDSDIDMTPMVIQVRCTICREVREEHILAESFPSYTHNTDDSDTYTDQLGECSHCVDGEDRIEEQVDYVTPLRSTDVRAMLTVLEQYSLATSYVGVDARSILVIWRRRHAKFVCEQVLKQM